MSDPRSPGDALQIDQVCDAFEAEWQAGRRPAIESYLAKATPARRGDLLRELLALEVDYRLRQGERPALPEYQQRFLDHDGVLRGVFAKPAPVLPAGGPPEAAAPALTLTALEGPNKGQVFTFAGHETFLVGRSKQAHLQLTDGYFSRFHFLVEINPPVSRLTDLGSRNGTYVNGQRAQTTDLRDGDVIKAGRTTLLLSIPSQGPAAADTACEAASPEARTLDLPGGAAQLEVSVDHRATLDLPADEAPRASLSDETAFDPPPPAARPAGDGGFPPVAGYRLLSELGRGGMGVVYLAVQEVDGIQVALKTIIPAVAANRNQLDRFLREADILRQLQHPHIVSFQAVGESHGRLFFAMDYVPGTDAAKLLKQHGAMQVRTAVRIVCQLLQALEYAHAKGFVHRDIKPANLLVAEEDGKKAVKLGDFGLARVYQESRMSGLTMQGDVGGTIPFMPPEQITQFRRVKPAADQYSAAATLYTLLTGRHVFDFEGAQSPLTLVLQEEPVPIRNRRSDLPEELAGVIHRALAKDPGARFPDVRAFRIALTAYAR